MTDTRDLLLMPTEHDPGVYRDEQDWPVMVAAYKERNYMMLWYTPGQAHAHFRPEQGHVLLEGVLPMGQLSLATGEGIEAMQVSFVPGPKR